MIRAIAPGKINLVFQVGQVATDGYHPVNSLYLELDLVEELVLSKGSLGSGFTIAVTGDSLPARHLNAVPRDRSNLVYQVAEYMFGRANIPLLDLHVEIVKRIPVAGGMAGGSADAAAMLVAVNEYLYEEHQVNPLEKSELVALAAEFGSDVPFSVLGGLAIGTEHGQHLMSLPALEFDTHFVIAISQEGLSTPAVFARFDQLGLGSAFTDLTEPITSLAELAQLMHNDLEDAAISLLPGIIDTKARLESLGAIRSMVSGSGPTVVGLFADGVQAVRAANELNAEGILALTASASYAGTRLQR